MKKLFLLLIPFLCFCKTSNWESLQDKVVINSLYEELVLNPENSPLVLKERLISNEEKAVQVAELFLFDIYGKDEIIKQKPYKICQYKDNWIITGSYYDENTKGGVFEIAIDSKTGRIVGVVHGE